MAGPFAHMTLVDTLSQDIEVLKTIDYLTEPIQVALLGFGDYCALGAISPDCPYFKLLDNETAGWGNVMHYWQTADFIRRAIPYVSELDWGMPDSKRCIAWLFGYVGHVITDLVIHPVVQCRVGDYEHHKTPHRICEMNQDAYIFHKEQDSEIITAEYFARGGPSTCHHDSDKHKLNPAIRNLWCHL